VVHLSRLDPPECFLWAARARGRVYSLTGRVFRWLKKSHFGGNGRKLENTVFAFRQKSDKVPPSGGVPLLSVQNRPVAGRARNAPRIVLDARGWCTRDRLGRFALRSVRGWRAWRPRAASPDVQHSRAWRRADRGAKLAPEQGRRLRRRPGPTARSSTSVSNSAPSQAAREKG